MKTDLNYLERAKFVEKELTEEATKHPDLWPSEPASTYILMLAAISQAESLLSIAESLGGIEVSLEELAECIESKEFQTGLNKFETVKRFLVDGV